MEDAQKTKRVGRLDDARSVRLELRKLYREARRGEMSVQDLTRFTAVLREMRAGLVADVIEERIAALERAAGIPPPGATRS